MFEVVARNVEESGPRRPTIHSMILTELVAIYFLIG